MLYGRDLWLKYGYRLVNRRENTRGSRYPLDLVMGVSCLETTKLDLLVHCILNALNNNVCRILLYGSDAASAPQLEAETDIAVLTPYRISEDLEARLSAAVFEWNQKHRAKLSIVDVDLDTFEEKRTEIPFYREIDRTGVVLWAQSDAPRV